LGIVRNSADIYYFVVIEHIVCALLLLGPILNLVDIFSFVRLFVWVRLSIPFRYLGVVHEVWRLTDAGVLPICVTVMKTPSEQLAFADVSSLIHKYGLLYLATIPKYLRHKSSSFYL
jgi:hypothetical protein